MAFQYQFSNYSFQDSARGAAAQEGMDSMSADGWRIHTAIMNYVEVSVLWEKQVKPRSRHAASGPDDPADE